MTKTFKAGDKVRLITPGYAARVGATATVDGPHPDYPSLIRIFWDDTPERRGQMHGGYGPRHFELVKKPVPRSIARDLMFPRSTRTLLLHLERHGSISHMEAQTVYGFPKVARQIWELRQGGIKIKTELRKDAKGLRYARYSLAA